MNKILKIFTLFLCTSGVSLSSFGQYNQNTSVYQRKQTPTANTSDPYKVERAEPSNDIYKKAGVRDAIYEEKAAQQIFTNSPKNNPGHELGGSTPKVSSTPKMSSSSYKSSAKSSGTSSYSTRSAISTQSQKLASGQYNTKRANVQTNASSSDTGYRNAKSLNFDGLKESSSSTKRAYQPIKSANTRRSTSYYSNYYGSSIKIYNQKGQRVSPTISNVNRNVIIVPKTGLTVTGIVVTDDPGRSITIKDNDGKSLSYQYTDMDALVNI